MSIIYSAPYKTFQNTTTETSLFTTAPTIPANFLVNGTVFRLWSYGTYNTDVVAPTLRIRVKLGAITLIDSGAQLMAANAASRVWQAEAALTTRGTGVSAPELAVGLAEFTTSVTAQNVVELTPSGNTTDTTSNQVLDYTMQWGTANANNIIQVVAAIVEYMPTP